MIGSMYVNSTDGDAQIVINTDGCGTGELRLHILNHDEGETAFLVVEAEELARVIGEARKATA